MVYCFFLLSANLDKLLDMTFSFLLCSSIMMSICLRTMMSKVYLGSGFTALVKGRHLISW